MMIYWRKASGGGKMPMYKKVMGALAVILLLVAGASFYEYHQDSQAVDLDSVSEHNDTLSPNKAAVYVTGEVAKPGVVYLPLDGRVGDAVNQCGGLLPTADSGRVNMAAGIKDGMEIRVEAKKMPAGTPDAARGSTAGNKSGNNDVLAKKSGRSTSNAGSDGGAEVVNINTADADGLRKLKGIGPAMAQRIIDYREANGAFQSPEDLQQVKGIGKVKYAKLKDQIAI